MGRHASEPGPQGRLLPLIIVGVVALAGLGITVWKLRPDWFAGDTVAAGAQAPVSPRPGVVPTAASSDLPATTPAPSVSGSAPPSGTIDPPDTCSVRGTVRIGANSSVLPLLKRVADDVCADLELTTADEVTGAGLLGTGQVDVWVPDSVETAYAAGSDAAVAAPIIAMSPVVLAAQSGTAALVAARGPLSWQVLLAPDEFTPLTFQVADAASAQALAGPLIDIAAGAAGDRYLGLAAVAGSVAGLKQASTAELSAPIGPTALRLIEARRLAGPDGTALGVPVLFTEGVPALRFPWVMPRVPIEPEQAAAAARMLDALAGPVGTRIRAELGYAEPGSTSVTLGGSAVDVMPSVDPADIGTLFGLVGSGLENGNALAVLDVSGSMADAAPGATMTPMDGVKSSASLMISSLPDGIRIGLWEFGEQLQPPEDFRRLTPIGPLSHNRTDLLGAIDGLAARRSGTALYNTVLAAYQELQSEYDPTAPNLLAVFSDGRNEDVTGMDLGGVLDRLRAAADPTRPVGVLFFGYGEADLDAMTAITEVTGGGVWAIDTPEQIIGAVIEAIGKTVDFG